MRPSGLVIIQFDYSGHRLFYVRLLAEASANNPRPLLLTTREAVGSREFEVHLGDVVRRGAVRIATVGSADEPVHRLVSRALAAARSNQAFRVLIPDADRLLPSLCWNGLRSRGRELPELRVLIMRTPEPGLRISRDSLVSYAKVGLVGALRRCWPGSRSYFLTDAAGVVTHRRGYRRTQPARDPSPHLALADRDLARREIGLPPEAFVLGLVGCLTPGKHADIILDALRYLPANVVALVAGQRDIWTGTVVDAAQRSIETRGRVISVPGYLSDAQLAQCISACDALVLLYGLDAPSGMLAAAIEANIPVLAGGSRWVVQVVERLGAGVIADVSPEGVAQAVRLLITAGTPPRKTMLRRGSPVPDLAQALLEA